MSKVATDMIERTLEEIDAYIKLYNGEPYGRAVEGTAELLERCKDIIQKQCGWTPVEDGLPKKTGYYLVTLSRRLPNEDYSNRVVVLFDGCENQFMCYENLIVAWAPLLEPYNQGKGGNYE